MNRKLVFNCLPNVLVGCFLVLHASFVVQGQDQGDEAAPIQIKCYDDGTFSRDEFPLCKELSSTYALHWRLEYGVITFGVAVAGKYKFVGLGFSDSGGMRGADMAILTKTESVTSGVAWSIGDYFSTGFRTPVLDDKQDYTLVSYSGTALMTLLTFSRPLDTCDDLQDQRIYSDTDQMVIFSYGQSFGYHGKQRGSALLRLAPANFNSTLNVTSLAGFNASSVNFQNTTESTYRQALLAQDPADLKAEILSVTAPQPLPSQPGQAAFVCVSKALRSAKAKNHIIRYMGQVRTGTPGAPHLMPRMTLYGCTAAPADMSEYDCEGQPDPACNQPLAFWGPGMKPVLLPAEAGLPFGGNATRYVQLVAEYRVEDVYDDDDDDDDGDATPKGSTDLLNPDKAEMVLYYTAQLRPYDLGVLKLGTDTPVWFEPGNTTIDSVDDICPAACTGRLVSNLTLVSNYFAMGSAGQSIKTQHIRNGAEVQPLGSKSYWWPGWQSFKQVLPESRVLAPGDSLITSCTYNTTTPHAKNSPCVNYLYYYPAVPGWNNCSRLYDGAYETRAATCQIMGPPDVSAAINTLMDTLMDTLTGAVDALLGSAMDALLGDSSDVDGGDDDNVDGQRRRQLRRELLQASQTTTDTSSTPADGTTADTNPTTVTLDPSLAALINSLVTSYNVAGGVTFRPDYLAQALAPYLVIPIMALPPTSIMAASAADFAAAMQALAAAVTASPALPKLLTDVAAHYAYIDDSVALVNVNATNKSYVTTAQAQQVVRDWLVSLLASKANPAGSVGGPAAAGTVSLGQAVASLLVNTSAVPADLLSRVVQSLSSMNMTVADYAAKVDPAPILLAVPAALISSADTVYAVYTPGCPSLEAMGEKQYATGAAIAAIVLVSAAMIIILAVLWVNYARKEDPERQALLAALQQAMLEEAVLHPDLTEDQLRAKLYDKVRKQLQDDGIINQ